MPRTAITKTNRISKEDLSMNFYLCKVDAEIKKNCKYLDGDDFQIARKISFKLRDAGNHGDTLMFPKNQSAEGFADYRKTLVEAKAYASGASVGNISFEKIKNWLDLAVKRVDKYIASEKNGVYNVAGIEEAAGRNSITYLHDQRAIMFERACNNIYNLNESLAATNKSLFTKQSKQFGNFRNAVTDLMKALDQGVNNKNAKDIVELINNVKTCKTEYDKHCERHPQTDSTRKLRVSLVENVMSQIDRLKQNDQIRDALGIKLEALNQPVV